MPRICSSKKEMKMEYLLIKKMEEEIEQKKKEIECCERLIRMSKDAIRNTYRLEAKYADEPQWESYRDESGWDSRHMWEEYDYLFTEEDEEEYREWNTWRICSPYDCTGQWFTRYISFFRIPALNKTIVYHSQGLDV